MFLSCPFLSVNVSSLKSPRRFIVFQNFCHQYLRKLKYFAIFIQGFLQLNMSNRTFWKQWCRKVIEINRYNFMKKMGDFVLLFFMCFFNYINKQIGICITYRKIHKTCKERKLPHAMSLPNCRAEIREILFDQELRQFSDFECTF